jgi:predicted lysophospholipase L1 biosynthesis ABC-type transport system permease subunit
MATLKSLGTREGHLASLCLVQACEILLLTMYWEKKQ